MTILPPLIIDLGSFFFAEATKDLTDLDQLRNERGELEAKNGEMVAEVESLKKQNEEIAAQQLALARQVTDLQTQLGSFIFLDPSLW